MPPYDHIGDLIAQNRLTLFLGADLPARLTGLPSRADLAAGLAQLERLPPGDSLATVAQQLMIGRSRWGVIDYLDRQIGAAVAPGPIHVAAARLPVRTIITSAYDSLLVAAFSLAGERVSYVVRDSDLPFIDARRRVVIALYGALQQRDTLAVSQDDLDRLWRQPDRQGLVGKVRDLLGGTAILFVGHDLSDPHFRQLWTETLDRMGRFAHMSYAVGADLPPADRRIWRDRQVELLDEDPLAFLEQLADAVGAPALSAAGAPAPAAPPPPRAQPAPALSADERSQLETLRREHTRRMYVLERQQAQMGIATPPHIVNEIEVIRERIAEIDRRLGGR